MDWFVHLQNACKSIRKTFSFGEVLLSSISQFKLESSTLKSYISDIEWFDYLQGIYDINDRKEVKESFSSNSKYSSSLELMHSIVSLEENKNEIQTMLHQAQIIDAEFYHATEKPENDELLPSKQGFSFFKGPSSYRSEFCNNTFVQSIDINEEEEDSEEKNKLDMKLINMKKCLYHYKNVTEKIEKHLKDQKNVFRKMLHDFIKFYTDKYKVLLLKKKDFSKNDVFEKFKTEVAYAFNELKEFIKIFTEVLTKFYKLEKYSKVIKYFLFTKESLMNFITSVLFDEEIYDLIFELQRKLDSQSESILTAKLKILTKFQPQDFDLFPKYFLNEKTEEHINNLNKRFQESCHNTNKTIDWEMESSQNLKTTVYENLNKVISDKKFSSLVNISNEDENTMKINEYQPYSIAIKNLKRIEKMRSPLHKLKNIKLTADIIEEEIRQFYAKRNYSFKDKIEGEQMLAIHVFIISKANVSSLYSHCALIDKFLSSKATNSVAGYYLVTMQVGLKLISNFDGMGA